MKLSKIIVLAALQIFSLKALAMGQRLHAEGTLEVQQAFVAKDANANGRATGEKLVFNKGTYKVSFGKFVDVQRDCALLFGCSDEKWVTYTTIDKSGGGSIRFPSNADVLKDGSLASYGAKTKQPFNVFVKFSEQTKNINYTTAQEECSIKTSCRGGADTVYDRCEYAMGTQTVSRHDKVTIKLVQAKFTNLRNEVIATFKGADDSTDKESIVDSTGKCILNINQ